MNLTTELAGLKDLQGTGDVAGRFRRNLERRFTLRTEAGVDPSAVRQPDDAYNFIGRVGQSEDEFAFRIGVDII